jgi:hypothetical protein
MEKPHVSVGSRWRVVDCGCVMVAAVGDCAGEPACEKLPCPRGGNHIRIPRGMIGRSIISVGPSTPKTVPPMGERPNGTPVGCLLCGKELAKHSPYECGACPSAGYSDRKKEWEAGARNFPRAAPSTEGAPMVAVECKYCGEIAVPSKHVCDGKRKGASPGSAREPDGYVMSRGHSLRAPEMQRQGVALTALQLIQSRKPPEPYICPVDDWDLLRDA